LRSFLVDDAMVACDARAERGMRRWRRGQKETRVVKSGKRWAEMGTVHVARARNLGCGPQCAGPLDLPSLPPVALAVLGALGERRLAYNPALCLRWNPNQALINTRKPRASLIVLHLRHHTLSKASALQVAFLPNRHRYNPDRSRQHTHPIPNTIIHLRNRLG
jgi:hypothetical protein